MAIKANADSGELLNRSMSRWAGLVCVVLALAGAAALAAYLSVVIGKFADLSVYLGGWIAVMVLMAIAGVQLARGRSAAQRLLLIFWLLAGVAAVVTALSIQLWGADWWKAPVQPIVVAGAVLGGSILASAMLVAASVAMSRLRYASYVTVSVAVAAALAIAINMISQEVYSRRDIETLGRYSLSERTRKILQTIKAPVRITCVYSTPDEKGKTGEYRSAVLELLQDMREVNPNIEVANARTETAKVKIVGRIRNRLSSQADKHIEFLKHFRSNGKTLVDALAAEQKQWATGEDSFLAMWALTADLSRVLGKCSQDIEQIRAKVAAVLDGSGLPNYATQAGEVVRTLSEVRDAVETEGDILPRIYSIPSSVKANHAAAVKSLDALARSVNEMGQSLSDGGDAALTLEKFAKAARTTADKARAVSGVLENIAGSGNAKLVVQSRYYRLSIPMGAYEVRTNLAEFFNQYVARDMEGVATDVEAVRKATKPEYQAETIQRMRAQMKEMAKMIDQASAAARKAVGKLEQIDDRSNELLKKAGEEPFKDQIRIIIAMLSESRNLPEIKGESLANEVAADNIVIIETGDKTGVVSFDAVWPLKNRMPFRQVEEGGQADQRTFNGDSAIASRLLSLTSDPFATVLLTYYAPPPEKSQMAPPIIHPDDLTTLKKRLEESNFEVKEWNLDEPNAPAPSPDRPQVLLVLPPPLSIPMEQEKTAVGFEARHLVKVRKAVDDGTPAIFLTRYVPPQSIGYGPPIEATYAYNDYLKPNWGIDVLTNYVIIPALPDETQPNLFKIGPERFGYYPLSTFSNQAIGKPLQAQRVLWTALVPILKNDSPPSGVSIKTVLEVPRTDRSTWATSRFRDLLVQLNKPDSVIAPDFAAGDMPAPLNVVVAATRKGGVASRPSTSPATSSSATEPASAPTTNQAGSTAPSRIVVMTVGASLNDAYLNQRVRQYDQRGTLSMADPPRADADLVINSVYWLVERENLIAAGPVQIRPVELISPVEMNILRVGCLIGLPLVVGIIGGLVLLARRR